MAKCNQLTPLPNKGLTHFEPTQDDDFNSNTYNSCPKNLGVQTFISPMTSPPTLLSETDLESVLSVLNKVNSEVEIYRRRNTGREGGKSEDLDSSAGRSSRLAGQRVPGQAVSHHVTFTGVHLNVDRRVDCLSTQLTHRLQFVIHIAVKCQFHVQIKYMYQSKCVDKTVIVTRIDYGN